MLGHHSPLCCDDSRDQRGPQENVKLRDMAGCVVWDTILQVLSLADWFIFLGEVVFSYVISNIKHEIISQK